MGNEMAEGRILVPINPESVPGLHMSCFGVIPKGHSSGKWRLITDLSYPERASINDGISPTLCSLSYTSVDKLAKAAQRLSPGALLAKVNIKLAYRRVPVHPDNRHVERGVLYQCHAPILAALGTKDIHCCSRCPGVVCAPAGCEGHRPLLGRFHYCSPAHLGSVRKISCDSGG